MESWRKLFLHFRLIKLMSSLLAWCHKVKEKLQARREALRGYLGRRPGSRKKIQRGRFETISWSTASILLASFHQYIFSTFLLAYQSLWKRKLMQVIILRMIDWHTILIICIFNINEHMFLNHVILTCSSTSN
jgi:hypothetical protein